MLTSRPGTRVLPLEATSTPAGLRRASDPLPGSPWGVRDVPAPAGMIAIQAVDEDGNEFGFLRVRADAWDDAFGEWLRGELRHHAPPHGPRLER